MYNNNKVIQLTLDAQKHVALIDNSRINRNTRRIK